MDAACQNHDPATVTQWAEARNVGQSGGDAAAGVPPDQVCWAVFCKTCNTRMSQGAYLPHGETYELHLP